MGEVKYKTPKESERYPAEGEQLYAPAGVTRFYSGQCKDWGLFSKIFQNVQNFPESFAFSKRDYSRVPDPFCNKVERCKTDVSFRFFWES